MRTTRSFTVLLAVLTLLGAAACAPDVPLTRLPGETGSVTVERPDTLGPLRMRGGDLVDAAGRVVLLHGMNSVKKTAPFISLLDRGELGAADRHYLVGSGFNAVRLGVSYAALMPTPGVIDEGYLDRVVDVVDALSADGLWVQLDFHQDVFHMMPAWATPPDAVGLSDEPPEFTKVIGWAAGYVSPKSLRQWDAFVTGEPFVQGRSVASWLGDAAAALAARTADEPNVIGIELLNEPFAGSAFFRCFLEGCGDVDGLLADRYAEMSAGIRAAAPEMPIWQEPFASLGDGGLPSRPVAPASDGPQIGLAWHEYCHGTDGGKVEVVDPATALWCQQRIVNEFNSRSAVARGLGAPRLLNEFGASDNPLDATLVTRLADAQLVSWMYWHHAGVTTGLDSRLPDEVESQIVRVYPQATAGTPRALSFDPVTGAFDYRYTPDNSITAPTSVVVPGRQYPDGYDVEVTGGSVTSPVGSGRLTVVADDTGGDVRIRIRRR